MVVSTPRMGVPEDNYLQIGTEGPQQSCGHATLPVGHYPLSVELMRLFIVDATGSGSPGSGPFTTIRRYDDTKSLRGQGGQGY